LSSTTVPSRADAICRFFSHGILGPLSPYVLIYWAMLGVAHALDYNRKYRDRELKALQLESRLAQANCNC